MAAFGRVRPSVCAQVDALFQRPLITAREPGSGLQERRKSVSGPFHRKPQASVTILAGYFASASAKEEWILTPVSWYFMAPLCCWLACFAVRRMGVR
jgi:hypothetical protein